MNNVLEDSLFVSQNRKCALPLCGYRTGISNSCKGSSSIKMLYVGAVYFSSGDWCMLE